MFKIAESVPSEESISSIPAIPELGQTGIPRNSVWIRFPPGIGLCSDGIHFKDITMHAGEGRRVIPVRNSGTGTNS